MSISPLSSCVYVISMCIWYMYIYIYIYTYLHIYICTLYIYIYIHSIKLVWDGFSVLECELRLLFPLSLPPNLRAMLTTAVQPGRGKSIGPPSSNDFRRTRRTLWRCGGRNFRRDPQGSAGLKTLKFRCWSSYKPQGVRIGMGSMGRVHCVARLCVFEVYREDMIFWSQDLHW